jgi:hypothetical protein
MNIKNTLADIKEGWHTDDWSDIDHSDIKDLFTYYERTQELLGVLKILKKSQHFLATHVDPYMDLYCGEKNLFVTGIIRPGKSTVTDLKVVCVNKKFDTTNKLDGWVVEAIEDELRDEYNGFYGIWFTLDSDGYIISDIKTERRMEFDEHE